MRKAILSFAVAFAMALSGPAAVANDVGNRGAISVLNTALSEFVDPSVQAGSPVVSRETANAVRTLAGMEPLTSDQRFRKEDTFSLLTSFLRNQGFTDVNPGSRRLDSDARRAIVQWAMSFHATAEADLLKPPPKLTIIGGDRINSTAQLENTGERALAAHIFRAGDVTTGADQPRSGSDAQPTYLPKRTSVFDGLGGDVGIDAVLEHILSAKSSLTDSESGSHLIIVGGHSIANTIVANDGESAVVAAVAEISRKPSVNNPLIEFCRDSYNVVMNDSVIANRGNNGKVIGALVNTEEKQCRLYIRWTDQMSLSRFIGDLRKNPIRVCGSAYSVSVDQMQALNINDDSTVVGLVVESNPKACKVDISVASDFNPMTMRRESVYTQRLCTRSYTNSDGERVDSVVYCGESDR